MHSSLDGTRGARSGIIRGMPPARPKRARSAVRRAATGTKLGEYAARGMILQGAATVFAEHGLRPASVEQILAASGVSRRTFYRLYDSKEDVAVALYRIGTERLVEMCRASLREETSPLRQIERCIDAHLTNARDFGRLVFVLGGEASGTESLLHARRMEVQETLVSLMVQGSGAKVDSLVHRALIIALEGITRVALAEGDSGRKVTDASLERVRRVMVRIATATLVGSGAGVAPLPGPPPAR
jgi:AcrR family transcriptional regulator